MKYDQCFSEAVAVPLLQPQFVLELQLIFVEEALLPLQAIGTSILSIRPISEQV